MAARPWRPTARVKACYQSRYSGADTRSSSTRSCFHTAAVVCVPCPPVFSDTGTRTARPFPTREISRSSDARVIEANRRVAAARGVAPAETALAWLLSRPGVTAPIVGATRLEHLESAVKALDLELTAAEVAALETDYQPHAVRGWIQA